MSQLHSDAVFLLLGLTIAVVLALRAVDAPDRRPARPRRCCWPSSWLRAWWASCSTSTTFPILLVAIHLLGAALTSAALTWLLVSVRERDPLPT